MLTAIAELSASRLRRPRRLSCPRRPPEVAHDAAERRQLTVMFCDLAGSTAISARLDPEDMREIIRTYQEACSGVVARYDGFLAKFMGDGVLAYFGFPRAHEDDAERAVRAGLDLVHAVASLETRAGEPLKARVGVATGIVVVGDLVGEGSSQEQAVVGDTPNLASRLQAAAEPGDVVIADSTRRLLGDAFEVKSLGLLDLKGFSAPTPAWAVLREAENVSRFEASRSRRMTPFVGREPEVALLVERWRDASAGEGKVVLLSGEAGIGKSRILATLRERVAGEPHIAIRYQCSPHHVNDAFHPIVSQIWRAAQFGTEEAPSARLDQARGDGRSFEAGGEGDRTFRRIALFGPVRGALSAPRDGAERAEGAFDRVADRALRGTDQGSARAGATGRRALDRPVVARRVLPADRPHAASARLFRHYVPPGVRRPLARSRARRVACAESLRQTARARHDRPGRRRQGVAARGAGADRGQDRRCPAVRRGTDQDGARVRAPARGRRRPMFSLPP